MDEPAFSVNAGAIGSQGAPTQAERAALPGDFQARRAIELSAREGEHGSLGEHSSGRGPTREAHRNLRSRLASWLCSACCVAAADDAPPRAAAWGRQNVLSAKRFVSQTGSRSTSPAASRQSPAAGNPDCEGNGSARSCASNTAPEPAGSPRRACIEQGLAVLAQARFTNPCTVLVRAYREWVGYDTEFDEQANAAVAIYMEEMRKGAFVKAAQQLAGSDDDLFRQLCRLAKTEVERRHYGGLVYADLVDAIPPLVPPTAKQVLESFHGLSLDLHRSVLARVYEIAEMPREAAAPSAV